MKIQPADQSEITRHKGKDMFKTAKFTTFLRSHDQLIFTICIGEFFAFFSFGPFPNLRAGDKGATIGQLFNDSPDHLSLSLLFL